MQPIGLSKAEQVNIAYNFMFTQQIQFHKTNQSSPRDNEFDRWNQWFISVRKMKRNPIPLEYGHSQHKDGIARKMLQVNTYA